MDRTTFQALVKAWRKRQMDAVYKQFEDDSLGVA
ncbi:MAG: hypothetical protein XD69_0595 [Clostridia bacterium 62_21]|nr:MAG: hypothetical protein XD69_0595 [Clostridia bacterium 62_21]